VKNSIPLVVSGLLLISGTTVMAQVGHQPARSPFLDLEHSQELTLISGVFHGHRDAADVAPQGGFLIGGHYEYRATGPVHLVAEIVRISSDQRVIDPFKVGLARELGTESRPLYSANVGLGLSLTGAKSWHHIVPEVNSGVGLISDFRSQADSGGFKFGTRFAFNWGAGIRYVPGGHWQLRGDITNRFYTVGYPEAFYIAPPGGTAVIPATQAKSFWLNSPAFTLGVSRLF
jgi:hypothetical protein